MLFCCDLNVFWVYGLNALFSLVICNNILHLQEKKIIFLKKFYACFRAVAELFLNIIRVKASPSI